MSPQEKMFWKVFVCLIAIFGVWGITQIYHAPNHPYVAEVPHRGVWTFTTCLEENDSPVIIFSEPHLVTPDGNVMKAEFFDGPTSLCYKDTLTLPAKTVRWEDRTLYYNPGKPNRYGHPSGWIHSTT